jgi:hypothetical protein
MFLTKVISSLINNLSQRVITVIRSGKTDTVSAVEANAFGIDSNCPPGFSAVYAPTSMNGDPVILGYVNKNQKAGVGEFRFYSTDNNGNEKVYIWLTAQGNVQFGGNADNVTRYAALNSVLQSYFTSLNTKLATAFSSASIPYTPPLAPDLSSAKASTLQTP